MNSDKISTRKSSICPTPPRCLYNANLIRNFLLVRIQTKCLMANKDPPSLLIFKKVAKSLELIWNKFSVPIISSNKTVEKITNLNNEYRKILKSYKGRKEFESYKIKLDDLKCKWTLSAANATLLHHGFCSKERFQ